LQTKKLSNSYSDFLSHVKVGITEVSDMTGISVRQLRYWEEKKIITSVNPNSSTRQFTLADIKKVILIKELIDDGYTLDGATAKIEQRMANINSLMDLIDLKLIE
jgi:DNA-binding transcriptional MerR regulator